MAQVKLKGETVEIKGGFIAQGGLLPMFHLINEALEIVTLEKFKGKKKVIATVPSVDTPVCSKETIEINRLSKNHPGFEFIIVSRDLPFAQKRFCKNEEVHNIILLSDMLLESGFGKDYGVQIASGPLKGLLARAVIVADEQDRVTYSQLVDEITDPPDFSLLEKALQTAS